MKINQRDLAEEIGLRADWIWLNVRLQLIRAMESFRQWLENAELPGAEKRRSFDWTGSGQDRGTEED